MTDAPPSATLDVVHAGVVGRSIVFVAFALTGAACRRQRDVEYVPSAPPVAAFRAWVYLAVYDQRPPGRGGNNPRRAGWESGTYGIPRRVRVAPDTVARNVWAASADALAQLGIGASGGPNRLVATVLEFWDDYVGGTGTHVIVRYQLLDPSGRERWGTLVAGGSGEPGHLSESAAPPSDAPSGDVFSYALAELSARARAQFATAAFQQALAP